MAVAIGTYVADDGKPGRVTGSLTQLGPVEVSLASAPGEATSPVCGCYKIAHRKDWRGVSFAARTVELSRDINGRASTYQITAAAPEPASWNPGYLFYSAEFLAFRHQGGFGEAAPFDPSVLPAGGVPAGWKLVQRKSLGAQPWSWLSTKKPLYVSMLGPTPIGAWIPSHSGRVQLGFRKGLTADAPLEGELREHDRTAGLGGRLSHPLADFLGPNVVVWTRDRTAEISESFSRVASPHTNPHGQVVLALFIRRPPFATRISALPLLVLPQYAGQALFPVEPRKTSGPYHLVLRGKPLTDSDYQRIQARLRENDVIRLHHLTGWFIAKHRSNGKPYALQCHQGRCFIEVEETLQTNETMRFRFPPRPPAEQGFTIFGPLRSLHLREAKGAFSPLPRRLTTPTEMQLKDVRLLGPTVEGAMPVPAREAGYRLDLTASGTSTVGDEPLVDTESFDWTAALTAIGILAGLLSLFFGAVAYVNRD